jgi:hypothetical protein
LATEKKAKKEKKDKKEKKLKERGEKDTVREQHDSSDRHRGSSHSPHRVPSSDDTPTVGWESDPQAVARLTAAFGELYSSKRKRIFRR